MTDDLHALEAWAGALLVKLQPAQRRAINHKVAIDLRRSQAQRIKVQQGPDGAAYPARKRRKEFKGKNGRIKRQKAAMFAKIRTAKHMKVKASSDQIEVGFFGWVARVARVHQFGQQEKIAQTGSLYRYAERPLLGLSKLDRRLVFESLQHHLKGK
ncbi:phage virion morphogenesis protein [Janthinobacterium lividum]|uniref:phage virion morphogenesis protein n=1 Tax=Janthinobacterium lividum TaxID=29581 RepID=UPI000452A5BE|nr:phage virion morphogenesis protein [Janthinobacterium lividum]EZP41413.1 Phage virion morphogenesis (putative tail completion) protein [Janthinobacterium lividum]